MFDKNEMLYVIWLIRYRQRHNSCSNSSARIDEYVCSRNDALVNAAPYVQQVLLQFIDVIDRLDR